MRAPTFLLFALFVAPTVVQAADLCLVKSADSRVDLFQAQQKFEGNGLAVRPCESLEKAADCDLIVVFNGFPSKKSAAQWEDETNAEYRAQYKAHGGQVLSIELAKNMAIYEYEADIFDGPTKIQLKHADLQPDFNFFPNLKYNVTGDVLKPQREAAAKMAASRPAPPVAAPQSNAAAPAAAEPSEQVLQRVAEAAARRATEEAERRQAARPPSAPEAKVASDVDQPKYHDAARPTDVALVIGIEKYNDLPDARFAERDAAAVRNHLIALGFAPRNVLFLTGARASRTGIATAVERKLPSMITPESVVFVYYSGHGAPDPGTGKAYLLPADGDPAYLEDTSYSVARLKEKLGALKAKRVLIALDACFSGAGGRSVLAKGTRLLVTRINEGVMPADVTLLAASGANEVAGSLDEQGHGVFTYFFLKGLGGGSRSFEALYKFVKPKVEDAARLSNRSQSPVLIGRDASL